MKPVNDYINGHVQKGHNIMVFENLPHMVQWLLYA